MGIYINQGNEGFQSARNGEYVDKSELVAVVNKTLFTEHRFSCVARCRRFGKSMAAKMLAAYYDHSCDSRSLFEDLKIAHDSSFEKHLNKYPVIYVDMTDFLTRFRNGDVVGELESSVMEDVHNAYPQVPSEEKDDLMALLLRVAMTTEERFFFIIDEWDAICREYPSDSQEMNRYVDLLRRMFKSSQANRVFSGVYMTGILPIKKYKTQSALNNFTEYSMVEPGNMAGLFGFTKDEVMSLVTEKSMDFTELESWYDGYQIGDISSIFNPNSVIQALLRGRCSSYWGRTATFETIVPYIQMNFEGLKDDIIRMLGGGRCFVDPSGFQNDLSIVNSRDDVLTVLIHLGYLSYNWKESECYIPNREVSEEMANAVKTNGWKGVTEALLSSRQLLRDTLEGNSEAVAHNIENVHDENTSILSYNNENSLACVISLAYYYAKNDYIVHREYSTGKGFADLVLIPRKNVDSPAIVVELKYNETAETGLSQIKRKNYPAKLLEYADRLMLVGISYDRKEKKHTCVIEVL